LLVVVIVLLFVGYLIFRGREHQTAVASAGRAFDLLKTRIESHETGKSLAFRLTSGERVLFLLMSTGIPGAPPAICVSEARETKPYPYLGLIPHKPYMGNAEMFLLGSAAAILHDCPNIAALKMMLAVVEGKLAA
jgi:hypothetical protein